MGPMIMYVATRDYGDLRSSRDPGTITVVYVTAHASRVEAEAFGCDFTIVPDQNDPTQTTLELSVRSSQLPIFRFMPELFQQLACTPPASLEDLIKILVDMGAICTSRRSTDD